MTEPEVGLASAKPGRMRLVGLWLLAFAVVLAVWRIADTLLSRAALARETAQSAIPVVRTLSPGHSPATEELVLPGSVQAFIEAPIYARTNGYLKDWKADIGAHVRKGEQLAEIETPEIDQELEQAQADLATANANAVLARSTNERWKDLLRTESVSQQDADAKAGDAAAKQAAADSARANVTRLHYLESFKRVVAPFDGVVTQRNTDIGALISAGQNTGAALFRVADIHKLRVYVQVPEIYAASTGPDVAAELHFAELPGRNFPAKVVRTANALDPAQRTLQVELQVDNENGALFPGAYAEVHFHVTGSAETLRVPVNALLFREAGLQIATVGADGRVKLNEIVVGRDFGSSIEVLSGISPKDELVINPPDSLADGELVERAPVQPGHGPASSPPSGPRESGKTP